MKVGIALNMLSQAGRPDTAVLNEHLQLGDLAEPLGFDSLFALEHHFTGYAISPESARLVAGSGLGLLIVMHNEWPKAPHEVYAFHQMAIEAGHTPRPPIILTNISCSETHAEATDRAVEWLGRKWDSVDN